MFYDLNLARTSSKTIFYVVNIHLIGQRLIHSVLLKVYSVFLITNGMIPYTVPDYLIAYNKINIGIFQDKGRR